MNIIVMLVLAFYAVYLLAEFFKLARSGNRRHIWPWLIVFVTALAVQLAYEFGAEVPSPTKSIVAVVTGLFPIK